ncbi:CLUMA_CG018915, isoform A [Clunio marinus]|uniref:CLUMA_CG018915, isoform A n=1 Tax=Clunio marinus TaxID=568069 RepID=A0A1J1J370_9DIPT|nr:CLUMA_CG018915, isoform A [Clunio marinus]
MTSTREVRREEYSTNVVRHLQPTRPLSPYSQKSEFDSNLDYILDDLQQSISRPGSSLGQPITHHSSHRDIQYLNPVNTTTTLRERSLSPNSSNKIYKTSKYEYSTASNSSNFNKSSSGNYNEINKLDTLLNDLEHERTATLDRNKRSSSNNIGIDSALLEPGTKVIKTTTTYTSKNPVSRELVFESPDPSINRSFRHQSPSSYEARTVESTTKRNVSYNDDGLYGKPRRTISPTPVNSNQHYVTETRTRTITPTPVTNTERYITETRTVNNEVVPIPKSANYNEVVRVENSTGPDVLRDVQLSDDILPKPKTKVTTTVRTYTYEIPEPDAGYPNRDPPKNTAMFYKTERNERSANYYPNQSPPIINDYPPLTIQEVPPQNTTTIHRYNVTNTSSSPPIEPQQFQQVPPGGITIYPPNQTTIYKTETVNTTNKQYRSPTPNNYPDNGPINHYPSPNSGHPHPHSPGIVYRQTTTTTNTRNATHPRPEREPLLHPFPVDGPIITEVDGSPPKRVEDLMASFGDTSEIHYTNKKVQIAEKPLTPTTSLSTTQTKVYSSEKEDKSKAVVPSKNITGPPVYYPPNHELFTSKEEGGYRAQGGYARGKGKYMYESESKSKSSSKSGAAVVPLCCPLCCAMPCTIM